MVFGFYCGEIQRFLGSKVKPVLMILNLSLKSADSSSQ